MTSRMGTASRWSSRSSTAGAQCGGSATPPRGSSVDVSAPAVLNGSNGSSGVGTLPEAGPRELPRSDARDALDTLLAAMVGAGGSDLHLTTNAPPMIRVHGDLTPLPDYELLRPVDTAELIRS